MKKIILLVFVLVSCIAQARETVDMNYKQDNAAYWYQKSIDAFSKLSEEQKTTLTNIKSIENAKAISQEQKKAFFSLLDNEIIDCLKKSHETKECQFYDKYLSSEKNYNPDKYSWLLGSRYLIASTWLLLSDNQQKKNTFIISCTLEMFRRMFEDRNPDSVPTILIVEKNLIKTIIDIYDSCKDDIYKVKLINFAKKLLPKPVCSFDELLRLNYEYTLHYLELFEKDYHNMVPFLRNVAKNTQTNISKCRANRMDLTIALDFYMQNNQDYNETDPDKIMHDLIHARELKHYLRCPWEHKYQVMLSDDNSAISRYIFTCKCEEKYGKNVNDLNAMAIDIAKEFMEKKYQDEKKEIVEYYEKLVNYNYSKALTQEEIEQKLDFYNLGSRDNILFTIFGLCVSKLYEIHTDYIQAYNELFKK